AVALYSFTLPEGHRWRFGAEVDPQPGSPLAPALALFGPDGQPIATANIGRRNTPNEPYLFAGLGPGTYYIGVSGQGNLPGVAGGYDLAKGLRGSITNPQDGGPFTLKLVADPVASPVRLLDATTNHADPADPRPTGLTLTFSGLLAIDTLRGD